MVYVEFIPKIFDTFNNSGIQKDLIEKCFIRPAVLICSALVFGANLFFLN